MKQIETDLANLRDRGLYRKLVQNEGIDFASNDFLGLSRSPKIRAALMEFLQGGGPLGATGSRLISGETRDIGDMEESIAAIFQSPSALFFGSGYLANIGVTGALTSSDSEFFSDEHNHASLIDGMRLTKSKISIFRHNDLTHLKALLALSHASRKIIVTESVFSMDGDGPNPSELRAIADETGAFLVLDEAHATGVVGEHGLGIAHGLGFEFERTIIVHTCGKALGGYGAFVTSSHRIRKLLVNRARSFIYSTAPSPIQIEQTRAAIQQIQEEPELRKSLWRNVGQLRARLSNAGIKVHGGHILSILIPGNDCVVRAAEQLNRKGLFVKAIRSPTVPANTERLRFTVKSFHTDSDLALLADSLKEIAQ